MTATGRRPRGSEAGEVWPERKLATLRPHLANAFVPIRNAGAVLKLAGTLGKSHERFWGGRVPITRLSPRPLVGFGWRRCLRGNPISPEGKIVACRLEPRQRRAQRIKARRQRIPVVFNGAPDCRCHRGQLVVREVKYWHGLAASQPLFIENVRPSAARRPYRRPSRTSSRS